MIAQSIRSLPPSSFAAVMATGIVGTALQQQGFLQAARLLLWLNVLLYGGLLALLMLRLASVPRRVWADFSDPQRGVGFLTLVAGTAVLGGQWVLNGGASAVAGILAGWTALLWLLLGYGFLTRVITAVQKPAVVEVLHGGWLLLVVATQGLAIMLLRVSARADVVFLSLCLFLIGSALYGILITLLMQRLLIERLRVQQFTSPYWINMGALAITTLAGGLLAAMLERQPDLVGVLPFVRGWTVLLWALGSWWVPLLVLLGVWKYVVGRQPIGYHVDHWSVVFPLGMYSVCTFTLAEAILPLPLLEALARWVARLALLAWLLVSVQVLLLGCARAFRRSSVT